MVFKRDFLLQEIFNIICKEEREDELRNASDVYNLGFDSVEKAFEFGFNLGEYVGKYFFGEDVYEFLVPESASKMYFIGDYETVKKKLYGVL